MTTDERLDELIRDCENDYQKTSAHGDSELAIWFRDATDALKEARRYREEARTERGKVSRGIYRDFTDSVDECRQRAFDIRKELGNVMLDAFLSFDAKLTEACGDFVQAYKEELK